MIEDADNVMTAKTGAQQTGLAYLLLLLAIAGGWAANTYGLFAGQPNEQLFSVIACTCPVFFSGFVFSSRILRTDNVSSFMAWNLIGALIGGLLENGVTLLGLRGLYIMALVIYAAAWACSILLSPKPDPVVTHPETK